MKIAITTDGNNVSAHFGRCPAFTLVDIGENKAVNREEIRNPGHQPGLIPEFLNKKGVDCIVCGGMGNRAVGFFDQLGIEVVAGISGNIDEVIRKLQEGSLEGGESLCSPGAGKGYGVEKTECDHTT